MPRLTRWLIRAAMFYLMGSLALGIAIQPPIAARFPLLSALWPTYLHLLVLGWLTQLIFGVAFWMFPRYSAERPRGSDGLGWAAFWLLNAGLLVRAVAEPWHAVSGHGGSLLVIAAAFQLGGGLAFAANTWPRVRER
ncbi:MAG TPA: hypothetical protein VIG08_07345 [Gemmatimonadales bacterium]|jgi:heme/copper-type cytochrome/quinol oxidase subunit 1